MPLRANPSPATPKKARQSQSIELTRKQMNRLSRVNVAELLTLDLHGMTQEEAHRKLNVFIRDAYNTNVRLILLITGKGSRAERSTYGNASYGVLKRVVPHWLESPSIRPWIIGYEEAAIGHGGGGALYIRLRQRSRSIDSDKSR
jgi:DNA-nicking Smr family endonuclease